MTEQATAKAEPTIVRFTPWGDLGMDLSHVADFNDAVVASGLTWEAEKVPLTYKWGNETRIMKGKNVIVRNDNGHALGTGSFKYFPYQNEAMFSFVRSVMAQSKKPLVIETAGVLDGGSKVWVLVKNGDFSPIKGDVISKYFLFVNSFDGSTAIKTLFTNIRVVCRNTLALAIRKAANVFSVRHTKNAEFYLQQASEMMGLRAAYDEKVEGLMRTMAQDKLSETKMRNLLDKLWPIGQVEEGEEDKVPIGNILREKKIERVMELAEIGAGTDIKGVKGTAYGLFQAITEYADHEKLSIRAKGTDEREVKFRSVLWGSAYNMKQAALEAFEERYKG